MAITHINRRGKTYYLHEGKTKTNKPNYFFSMKEDGTLAATIPAGFEIYENPNGQVFLRKVVPRLVTDEEVAVVERGIRELAKLAHFRIDVKGKDIIVYLPEASDPELDTLLNELGAFGSRRQQTVDLLRSRSPLTATMKFSLCDDETREFHAWRWCFLGSIDDWFPLDGGQLKTLVKEYCPHLGKESFFELM